MKLHLNQNKAILLIKTCRQGIVRINDNEYSDSLLIAKHAMVHPWTQAGIESLNEDHWKMVLDLYQDRPQPLEVVILGTGATLQIPKPAHGAYFMSRGIGFEFMDTAAACRTYNILAHDDREVVAALLP